MSAKSRSEFLKHVGSLTAAAGVGAVLPGRGFARAVSGADKKLPNVVLIMTDDEGWGDIRSHDNKRIDTPVMDVIAAAGARQVK